MGCIQCMCVAVIFTRHYHHPHHSSAAAAAAATEPITCCYQSHSACNAGTLLSVPTCSCAAPSCCNYISPSAPPSETSETHFSGNQQLLTSHKVMTSYHTTCNTQCQTSLTRGHIQQQFKQLTFNNIDYQTHTHSHFTALCPGLPGWVGKHPLTPKTCCGSLVIILDFMRNGEDNRGKCTDNPAGCHIIRVIDAPTSINPQFYTGCPSCRNSPNLSWLGLPWHQICWIAYLKA